MQQRGSQQKKEKASSKIKRVYFWRIVGFTKLNNEIHEKDPIFKRAAKSFWKKLKFSFSFGWKLFWQRKFVLLENGQVAGALSLDLKKNSVFVYAIGVLEPFRRKGFGTMLMNFAEDFTHNIDRRIIFFSVLLENEPALSMYRKLGYRSLGVGLTMLRFFLRNLTDYQAQQPPKQKYHLSFKQLQRRKEIKEQVSYWWAKEVEALCGEEPSKLYLEDFGFIMDFDRNWHIYKILNNNEPCGLVAIMPNPITPTIVFFSDPHSTWNLEWTMAFIKAMADQKLDSSDDIPSAGRIRRSLSMKRQTFIQLFLTYQHKNGITPPKGSKLFSHDQTEDRQILFKEINSRD